MSSNEYFLAWSIYAVASFFVIIFWFWATSIFSSVLMRLLLRLPVMAILLTPIPHVLDPSLYVPVVAAVAFDFISKDSLALSEDLMTLVMAVFLSVVLAFVLVFVGHMFARLLRGKEAG